MSFNLFIILRNDDFALENNTTVKSTILLIDTISIHVTIKWYFYNYLASESKFKISPVVVLISQEYSLLPASNSIS